MQHRLVDKILVLKEIAEKRLSGRGLSGHEHLVKPVEAAAIHEGLARERAA